MKLGELPDLPNFHDGTWNFPKLLDHEKVFQPWFDGTPVPEGYSPAYVDLQYVELRVYCWEQVPYPDDPMELGYYYHRRRLDLDAWKNGEVIWGEPRATRELLS